MKRCLTLFFFSICVTAANSQGIDNMINEGIELHDKGKYEEAIIMMMRTTNGCRTIPPK